jgi:5-methylcytosine-specific restriction enzyme subunit McrC
MASIPVQNLYYLLSYAWDLISESDPAPVSLDDARTAPDMLALLLAGGIESLGRRGLYRDYQARTEETGRLKGKIDFATSIQRLTHRHARLVCHFDELGTDNTANGILRTTLDRLLGSASIDTAIKARLREAAPILRKVPAVRLKRGCFKRALISRHHSAYRMALSVCELLYELAQPDSSGNSHHFVDPWSEKGMPRVFETFVRNFLRRHLPEAKVSARQIAWDAKGDTTQAQALLPSMKTDVTIEWGAERCMILDCKFYADSFSTFFDQARLNSSNLYQIAAYLHHHQIKFKGGIMYGVLLYPTVDVDFLHQYDFMGHRLTVASVDLGQRWQSIHERLLQIITTAGHTSGPNIAFKVSSLDVEIATLEKRLEKARALKKAIFR